MSRHIHVFCSMYISPDVFLGYIYGTTDTTTLAYYLKLKKSFHSTSFHFRYFDVILQNPLIVSFT